jgi:hypothetical protein
VHRSLGLVHQGTILDLVRKRRVFLWLLYNSSLKLSRLELLPIKSSKKLDFSRLSQR